MSGYFFFFTKIENCLNSQKSLSSAKAVENKREENHSRANLWRHRAGGNSAEYCFCKRLSTWVSLGKMGSEGRDCGPCPTSLICESEWDESLGKGLKGASKSLLHTECEVSVKYQQDVKSDLRLPKVMFIYK